MVRFLGGAPAGEAPAAIGLARYEMKPGERFGEHRHDCHQIAWSASGAVQPRVGERAWHLPPALALWIPSGARHDVVCAREASFVGLYLPCETSRIGWREPTLLAMTPLLRALIERLADTRLSPSRRAHLERVVFDELVPLPGAALELPLPADPRARRVARALIDHPADDRSIDDWGRLVGASRRTLARRFAAETGMSFATWRTQARMRAALVHLAASTPSAVVAARVGYRNPGAFSVAFRRIVGSSPRDHSPARRAASLSARTEADASRRARGGGESGLASGRP